MIFDCADNELYIHCLHSVIACACAEVEVPIFVKKKWQHHMTDISGGGILPEGAIIPHSPLCAFVCARVHGCLRARARTCVLMHVALACIIESTSFQN